MKEIVPNLLWTGTALDKRDVRSVLELGVTAIIDVAMEEPPTAYPREIVYCRFPLVDGSDNPLPVLKTAVETTAALIVSRVPTMVACSGGMSRSPAIVAAALSMVDGGLPDDMLRRITSDGPHDVSMTLWADIQKASGS